MNQVDFMTLGRIVSDERLCFEYLLQKLPAHSCPFCQSRDNCLTSRQRVRCTHRGKDIQPLAGTKFSLLNIPCSTWLILLKLFELSISAWKAAEEAGLSNKTTLKGYHILRHAITEELAKSDDLLKGEVEADEAYIGGRRKGKREHSTGTFYLIPGDPRPLLMKAFRSVTAGYSNKHKYQDS